MQIIIPGSGIYVDVTNPYKPKSERSQLYTYLGSKASVPRKRTARHCQIATLGIFGNAVVIFVILHSASMRSKFTNILILNQSCTDFATSVLILLTKTLNISKENLSGVGGDIL